MSNTGIKVSHGYRRGTQKAHDKIINYGKELGKESEYPFHSVDSILKQYLKQNGNILSGANSH